MSTVDLVTDTDAAIIDMSNIQQTRWNLFTLLQDTKHVQRWQKVVDEIPLPLMLQQRVDPNRPDS